jgi:hypothetical protein
VRRGTKPANGVNPLTITKKILKKDRGNGELKTRKKGKRDWPEIAAMLMSLTDNDEILH